MKTAIRTTVMIPPWGAVDAVRAYVPGRWVVRSNARAVSSSSSSPNAGRGGSGRRAEDWDPFESRLTTPSPGTALIVPVSDGGWRSCPEVLRCTVPVQADDRSYRDCVVASCYVGGGAGGGGGGGGGPSSASKWLDVNLRKSKSIFDSLAFVTSRASLPEAVSESWLALDNSSGIVRDGEDAPCPRCSPVKPGVRWTRVTKGKRSMFIPKEDVKEAAGYEQTLKNRPHPWVVRLRILSSSSSSSSLELSVGCNAVSLTQRSMGLLPRQSLARRAMMQLSPDCRDDGERGRIDLSSSSSRYVFEWRVVEHVDRSSDSNVADRFPKMYLTSNKKDEGADQPPHFERYPLRPEQLRSLRWMLAQEATSDPFWEEEVSEGILPGLNWRAEGRARRPVVIRGGIVADEVCCCHPSALSWNFSSTCDCSLSPDFLSRHFPPHQNPSLPHHHSSHFSRPSALYPHSIGRIRQDGY